MEGLPTFSYIRRTDHGIHLRHHVLVHLFEARTQVQAEAEAGADTT
jgi:hypothetical protein